MHFTGKTRVFGVIGDPIAHSLSPLMQNAALRAADVDAIYVAFHVFPHILGQAIDGIRSLQVGGVNVTVPHKSAVIPLLDQVDEEARMIGAVNTIVNRDGVLTGYNTDVSGFRRTVRELLNFDPAGKDILILGAGGACRAAVVALSSMGAKQITVANRTLKRAEQLVVDLAGSFPAVSLAAVGFDQTAYLQAMSNADLAVNATSVGLKGEIMDFFTLDNFKSSSLIYDMVYSRIGSPLVLHARQKGFTAIDGLGMLAAQGEDAFSLFTGRQAPPGLMMSCLEQYRQTDQE